MMTNDKIIEKIKLHIANCEEGWEFEQIEGIPMLVVNSAFNELEDAIEKEYEIGQVICLYTDHVLMSKAYVDFEFEPDKKDTLESYLKECSEKYVGDFFLDYDKDADDYRISVKIFITCDNDDADKFFEDEELLNGIFHAPTICLCEEIQEITDMLQKLIPADELPDFRNQIRYNIEHEKLPVSYFHNEKEEWNLLFTEGGLYDYIKNLFEIHGVKMPYAESDYRVFTEVCDKDYTLKRISLPKPEETPLCREIYLMYNEDCSIKFFFTIERGSSVSEYYLCSWDGEGNHSNYDVFKKGQKNLTKVMEQIFLNKRH